MTEGWTAIVCCIQSGAKKGPPWPWLSRGHGCRTVRVPRTEPPADWEARRHANEEAFWARQFDHFVQCLPRMRRHRGDARAARLVRDVIEAIKAAQGADAAVVARERLSDVWRGRPGP